MHALADLSIPQSPLRISRGVLDLVRESTLATCRRHGVIRTDRMSVRKYLAGRFELLAALAYPDADLDALALCNDFHIYLFYVDDQAEEDESYGKRPAALEAYFASHIETLRHGRAPAGDDPAGRLLLDLRERLLRRASGRWLARFADDVSDYLLRGTLGGARHWTAGTVPSFSEYAEQRIWDSAVQCTQDLIEVAGGGELPEHVHALADFAVLRRLCTNVVAFTNDLVSYPKEVRQHSSPNNLVHVVMTHEQLGLASAIERVIDIVNADIAAWGELAAALPVYEAATALRVERYLSGQRAWMRANLLWSLATGRYADPQSPFAELRLDPTAHLPAEYHRSAGDHGIGDTVP